MKMQLETERLILRNFVVSDLEDYWEYAQMQSVGPRAGWKAYTDKEKAKERLLIEASKPNQFAIVLKSENKVIGSVELMDCKQDRYSNLNIEEEAKEIGAVLSEKYWGQGYMPEAVKEIMRYAFVDLSVPVIYCGHAKANTNSARLQDKCGFKIIGELPNYREWVDGSITSLIERKMTSEEYHELQRENLKIK
jgi:RimJ/RimL family protein N-acetyltransferase